MGRVIGQFRVALLCSALTTSTVAMALPSIAVADGPNVGGPWVVTVGDSAISGEAGRWAGNTNQSSSKTDTGANAYNDNSTGTAEAIAGCHRSKAAEVHIGGGISSLNLACSGARTYTQTGSNFKPGLDWYNDGTRKSQVVSLQEFAGTHNVEAVTVLIGANNYGFADIVQQCITNWLTSPSWWKNYCYDDSSISSRFTSSAVNARTEEVKTALLNVAAAMSNAGYQPADWKLIVQTYWSPIPNGSQFRYGETGWTRQNTGGCGVWNRDANWANATAVTSMNYSLTEGLRRSGITNAVTLDMSASLNGHRICENGVGLLEEKGIATWQSVGAADASEWVSQVRTATTILGPYQLQEGLHANYWGQLAMRNCLRQAYNNGVVRSGRCTPGTGVNASGEPNMVFTPT